MTVSSHYSPVALRELSGVSDNPDAIYQSCRLQSQFVFSMTVKQTPAITVSTLAPLTRTTADDS
jgi:hypothetical protein